MTDDTAWVEGSVEAITDLAIGLRLDDDGDLVWLPKSQILYGNDEPELNAWEEFEIPGWLARAKGLD